MRAAKGERTPTLGAFAEATRTRDQFFPDYRADAVAPTVYFQLLYEIAHGAMADELGEAQFKNLLHTPLSTRARI